MSDAFDPDAWPYPQGGRPQQGSGTARRNDDDYDDLSFDDQDFAPNNYADDDDFETSTTGRPAAPGYDDYAYEDEAPARPAHGRHADEDLEDDYETGRGYSDGYDDEYDDEYDDDDFDREVSDDGGNGRKIIGILAGVALLGALVIGAVALLGGGGDQVAQTPPQTQITPNAPANNTTGGVPADAPPEVLDAVDRALEAWGVFAVNGDLDAVRPYFVNQGPQFNRFQAEAPEIRANPPGGEPMVVTMVPETTTQTQTGDWLVKGVVTFARPGSAPQEYPWELHLSRQAENEPWQVLSVRQF